MALGAYWQVTAGILLGRPEAEHTRRWDLSGDERREPDKFTDSAGAAAAYAIVLQLKGNVNWVTVEYVWL